MERCRKTTKVSIETINVLSYFIVSTNNLQYHDQILMISLYHYSPNSRILKIWNAWGEERSHVNFIVKRASTTSNRNSGENTATSDAFIHKTLVSRNSSISRRQDVIPNISSSGTARTRRKVRRRNSTSSVGKYSCSILILLSYNINTILSKI